MIKSNEFIVPNGHFDTSNGIHKYAISAKSAEGIRRQTNDFHDKVFQNGGRVLDEKRKKLPQGSTYILYTYEI